MPSPSLALDETIRATTLEATDRAFDAIVIGAGAAGGLAAQLLCEAGLEVLLLDAGFRPPFWSAPVRRLTATLVQSVADPRIASFAPPAMINLGRKALRVFGGVRQPVQTRCFAWERMPEAFVDDIDCPYETPRDKPFTWIRTQGLGGRMIVPGHGRQYYRLGPDDFAPRDGLSPRWPFAPGDLDRWYSLVEQRLALFGERDGVPFAPDSDIAHLLRPTTSEAVLRMTIQSQWPKAAAILGRYAPPLASVEAANATGKLWCRTGALVQRVEADGDGRVRGVEWHDRQTRCNAAARAPMVFLCASTLESTRILMMSQSGTGNGLARSSEALGRHLMDHIMVKVEGVGHKLAGERVSIDDGRCLYLPRFDLRDGGQDPSRGYGVQVYQGAAGGDQSYFTAVAFCEMAPRAENRVSLDASRKDAWGAPALRIECSHNDTERALARKMTTALRDLTKLVDAKVGRLDEAPDMPGTAIHECGTARMGDDPTTSVLDPHNQCWDARGLYVTDGASFPSQGSQNPTLTIMALTARACDHALRSQGVAGLTE